MPHGADCHPAAALRRGSAAIDADVIQADRLAVGSRRTVGDEGLHDFALGVRPLGGRKVGELHEAVGLAPLQVLDADAQLDLRFPTRLMATRAGFSPAWAGLNRMPVTAWPQ